MLTLSPIWHPLREDNSPFQAIFPINICTQFVWAPRCLLNRFNGLETRVELKAVTNHNSNLVYVWPTLQRSPVGWHFSRNCISLCEGYNSITQCLPTIALLNHFTLRKVHTAVCTAHFMCIRAKKGKLVSLSNSGFSACQGNVSREIMRFWGHYWWGNLNLFQAIINLECAHVTPLSQS